MKEIREILISLKSLSANDLITLQREIARHIYAKGVEDFIHNSQLGHQVEQIEKALTKPSGRKE